MLKITLAAARCNAGMTKKQVADALEVAESTIYNWESGKHMPKADMALKLCELYGVGYDNIRWAG